MKYQIVLLLCLLLISSCGQTTEKVTSDFESAEEATRIEIDLDGSYMKGRQSVDEYLKETAIVNPHTTIMASKILRR